MEFIEEDILARVRKAYREGEARFEIEARRTPPGLVEGTQSAEPM